MAAIRRRGQGFTLSKLQQPHGIPSHGIALPLAVWFIAATQADLACGIGLPLATLAQALIVSQGLMGNVPMCARWRSRARCTPARCAVRGR